MTASMCVVRVWQWLAGALAVTINDTDRHTHTRALLRDLESKNGVWRTYKALITRSVASFMHDVFSLEPQLN